MNGIIQHQALQLEKEKRAIFIQSVEENRVSEVTLKKKLIYPGFHWKYFRRGEADQNE